MSLEEVEKELKEVEVIPETKLGLGTLICLILYVLFSVAIHALIDSIGELTNFSVLISLLEGIPVRGLDIAQKTLNGNYYQAVLLLLPIVIAGLIGGAVAKSGEKGALAGLIAWIILFIAGLGIVISSQGFVLSILENYLDRTLFLDVALLSILGAIGGTIREEKIEVE